MPSLKLYRLCFVCLIVIILILVWIFPVYANGPGELDLTFKNTGIVTTSVGNLDNWASSVAIQPDGKIVVAGNSKNQNDDTDFAVIRYKSDGNLDNTFNGTGVVTTPIGNSFDFAKSVAIQPDGKIVVVGSSDNGIDYFGNGHDFAIVRYKSNGQLDETFNGTGIITRAIGSGYDTANSVVIQSDGKIVVGGSSRQSNGRFNAVILRYDSNGQPDTEFKNTGIVTTSTNSGYDAHRLALQPDNKIVVVGDTEINGKLDFIIIRYDTAGELDTTFNGSGVVTTPVGTDSDIATCVTIQSDGKIVVGGILSGGGGNSTLVRYESNGQLDPTFNQTGIVTTSYGFYDQIYSIAIQPDGKIVTAGFIREDSYYKADIAVVRYNNDGTLDTAFNDRGVVTTSIGNEDSYAENIMIQSDSKIVVVGNSGTFPNRKFTTVRYLGNIELYLPIILKD